MTNTVIENNYIGTNTAGDAALPNFIGVGLLLGASGTQITHNVISGNSFAGIAVGAQSFVSASDRVINTTITGNYIGTNASGDNLGNNSSDNASGAGISINSAEGTQIGGVGSGQSNVIAFNRRAGIALGSGNGGNLAAKNSFRGNSIHDNIGLGIDLVTYVATPAPNTPVFGVTPNDADDADTGSNGLQNFPELLVATSGASTHLEGKLNSVPSATFTLDFYANASAESAGFEGRRYLGSATATTDASGDGYFLAMLPSATSTGEYVTATATDALGNTSEFSAEFVVSDPSSEEQAGAITVSAAATDTDAEVDQVVAAVNALPPQTAQPVEIVLNLASGVTYGGLVASPPAGVTLIINGDGGTTTIEGASPALTVTSGMVIVTGMNFTNTTDASTILVTGGTLQLRNSTVHETTGGNRSAIEITGGSVDLGTEADPGGNTLYTEGAGSLIRNPNYASLSSVGNTYYVNDALQSDGELDPAFGDGGTAALPSATTLRLEPVANNQTVVVQGNYSNGKIVRLNVDGTLDSTFGTGPTHSIPVTGYLDLAMDGEEIYVLRDAAGQLYVSKYDADGNLDLDFGAGGSAEVTLPFSTYGWYDFFYEVLPPTAHLVVTPEGIVVAATHTQINGADNETWTVALTRLRASDQQVDTTFGDNGVALGPQFFTEDQETSPGDTYIPRLHELLVRNGELVLLSNFYASHNDHSSPGFTIFSEFDASGDLLSQRDASGRTVAALNSYQEFFPDSGLSFSPRSMAQQGDQIVAAGVDFAANYFAIELRRFNADGTLDQSFGDLGVVELRRNYEETNISVTYFGGMAIAPDGKIVVSGVFGYPGSDPAPIEMAYRLTPDGLVDATFGDNGSIDGSPRLFLYASPVAVNSASAVITTDQQSGKLKQFLGSVSANLPHAQAASVSGPSERLRDESFELTLGATDPNPLVEAAGYSYVVDWGDGSPFTTVGQTAGNGSGRNVAHAYGSTGTFEVTVSATDVNNHTSEAVFSITVSQAAIRNGYLLVAGTPGDDEISVIETAGVATVKFSGDVVGMFAAEDVPRDVYYILRGGADTIVSNWGGRVLGTAAADSITLDAFGIYGFVVYAGDGNDSLTISSSELADITALGGDGDDSFNLTTSDDSKIGVDAGEGNDTLEGLASGNSILSFLAGPGQHVINAEGIGNSTVELSGNEGDSLTFAGSENNLLITSFGDGTSLLIESTGTGGASVNTHPGAATVTILLGSLAGTVAFENPSLPGLPDPTPDSVIVLGTPGDDTIFKTSGLVTLGSPVTESITWLGEFSSLVINGGAGNDTITDPGQNTIILGGPGNDTIIINATVGTGVVLDGGPGSDSYVIGGGAIGDLAGPVAVADSGTTGVDTITVLGTTANDSIDQTSSGFSLNETPISVAGLESATVNGGGGTDAVIATGTPPVPVQVVGVTDLIVIGTSGNDQIHFTPGSLPGEVVARLNGAVVSRFVPTGKLVAYGGAGNDDIQVAGSINLAAWLYGEGGNDRLNNGAGGGLLIGGDGNDELSGGNGRDILVGGQGADKLLGNANDDILIAGFTLRDDRTAAGHDAFWQSVLAEWNSGRTLTQRVRNLKGLGTDYTGALLLPEVRDDFFADQIDFLNGAAGNDWLIYLAGEDQVAGQAEAAN